MHAAVQVARFLDVGAFTALGIVAARQWVSRRDEAAKWLGLSFGGLGLIVLLSLALPQNPSGAAENVLQRFEIAILLLFPYLLYRFTRAFRSPHRGVERFVTAMSILMVAWTFALPHIPAPGEHRSGLFVAYLVGFLVHWTVLSVVVTYRLWVAGRDQPGVARRRMRMLAFASVAITVAIFLVAGSSNTDSAFALASQLASLASSIGFLLGVAPPPLLRLIWRRREQQRLQEAIANLMAFATNPREIALRVLEPMAAIVGARSIAIRDERGEIVGRYELGASEHAPMFEIPFQRGSLEVMTSPYAPFFGDEELRLLRTLGALTGLALDRARLFEEEHQLRVALERADELKSNFVALAAHELRTPVTAIHGFVYTLQHRTGLPYEQEEELKRVLEQQTGRLAMLVEQLLDLSRLDAEAVEIHPQIVHVRDRLEETVRGAAGERAHAVELRVEHGLEATVDPVVLERVVGNLVTNALRYGEPPVVVTAERSDRHFRVAVEDRGQGVDPEFVPDLFERFARSQASRGIAIGTGLGLAIARSYARAHRGDLLYSPAAPHGARFELVLPSEHA